MAAPTVSEPRTASGGDRRSQWVSDDSRLAIQLHYLSLAVTFVTLAYLCRNLWFYNDDFLVQALIRGRGVRGVFEPFAEHWMAFPKLLAHLNFAAVGFKTYWPTILALLVANTVVGHLLWRVMRQVGVSAWIATGLAAVYLVMPGNTMRQIVQVGWFAAVALGLGAMLCVNSGVADRRRDLVAAALMLVAVACHSGVAIGMLLAVALVALARRGWRSTLVVVVPPVAAYLVWLAVIGRNRVQELPSGVSLGDVPRFVVTELPGTVASPTRLGTVVAVLVLVIVGVWLVVRWRDAVTARAPAFAMALVVVALFVAVARSRTDVAYRYAYLAWLLFLPALGLTLHDLARRPARRCLLAIGLTAVLGLIGLARFVDIVHDENAQARLLKEELTVMAQRTRTDGYVPEVIVDNDRAPLLRAEQVAEWARDGKFPKPSRPVSPGELRDYTSRLQARYVPKPPPSYDAGARPMVVAIDATDATPAGDGCLRLAPSDQRRRVELDVSRRAAIRVEGVKELVVSLPSLAGDGTDATFTQPVIHHDTQYVEFAAGTHPRVEIDPRGTVTVCGVEVPADLTP